LTKIRKVDLKVVASKQIQTKALKELDTEDPENAREIIELCGKNIRDTREALEVRGI